MREVEINSLIVKDGMPYEPSTKDSLLLCGFQLGVENLNPIFEHCYFSDRTRNVVIRGKVTASGPYDVIPEATISIGRIGECQRGLTREYASVEIKAKTISDSSGRFTIISSVNEGDCLIVSKFTYLASIYKLDRLLKIRALK